MQAQTHSDHNCRVSKLFLPEQQTLTSGNGKDELPQNFSKIIGLSSSHVRILEQINRMKDADASVLITGESGTGKELVARALYESSVRQNAKFEAVNCGAIPETLLESELFGHKRGAFTDAKSDKKGLFEVCSGGVLFLDEIGEMPLSLQVKLLRVLQEREVRPLGSTCTIKVNARIVAATNCNLLDEIEKGNFRRDLYYRLAVLKIHITPLRERLDDIPILANFFVKKFNKSNGTNIAPLSDSQLERIKAASWPGNIRELQNGIERAVVLSQDNEIDLDDMFEQGQSKKYNLTTNLQTLDMPLRHADAKKMFETLYLENLLKHSAGNVSEAARMSEKSRVEIYRYLSRNHMVPSEFRI